MESSNRREFSLAAAAAAGTLLNLNPRARGANERITLGLIGGRNQGRWVAGRAIKAGAVIKTICDVDEAIIDMISPEIEKAQGAKQIGRASCRERV